MIIHLDQRQLKIQKKSKSNKTNSNVFSREKIDDDSNHSTRVNGKSRKPSYLLVERVRMIL